MTVQPIRLFGDPIHEVDHLDGVLFLDRLDPAVRREAMRQIRASDWLGADPRVIKANPPGLHGIER